MPVIPLRTAYLLFASFVLEVLAFILSFHDRYQPESHPEAVATLVLGAVILAVVSQGTTRSGRKRRAKHTSVYLLRRGN